MIDHDAEALEWYNGAQSLMPVQSVIYERHIYLDDDEADRYRACRLYGTPNAPHAIGGKVRFGGIGVVDTGTGRLVIHTIDDDAYPRQSDPLAREITALARGEYEGSAKNVRGGRHAVTVDTCRFTGITRLMLRDMSRRRHGEGGYPVCWIPIDPSKEMTASKAEALLTGFAQVLDGRPLDWTGMRRRPKPLTT